MLYDRTGLVLSTTSPAAAAAYDAALFDMLEYRLSMGDRVKAALDADPGFLMGHVLRVVMLLGLSSTAVAAKVDEALAGIDALLGEASAREQRHVAALKAWSKGHVRQARSEWSAIVANHPQDLLALRLHHFNAFWQGDREALRALPAQALSRVDNAMPGYGFLLSMVAFGSEECGDYRVAETYGRQAVELNGEDLWGIHAVAHVMEMEGRTEEGVAWLAQPLDAWADRNPFQEHVWWHRALFLLDLGRIDETLELFDKKVDVDERGFYLDVQNAASLLMRLRLAGIDVGGRWEKLARLAVQRTGDHVLPFTDAHFVLALIAARHFDEARRYLASQQAFAAGSSDAALVTRDVGVALTQGLIAYGEGREDSAVELITSVRDRLWALGGSHAQQDIFRQILIDAAERAGKADLARSLLVERSGLMRGSRWGDARLAALGTGN